MAIKVITYLLFIISVASAAASIILSARLRSRYRTEVHSTLVYFLVFIFTFGFYGLWGRILIEELLKPVINAENIRRFSDYSLLIGLPFLVFAWLMLLRLICSLTGRIFNLWQTVVFLFGNLTSLVFIGWIISGNPVINPLTLISGFFVILNTIYIFSGSMLLFRTPPSRSVLFSRDRKNIGLGLMTYAILVSLPLFFYPEFKISGPIMIFIFFTGNTFLPAYLNYCTLATKGENISGKSRTLEEFFKEYDISPRESDIVREICNGLSNREISDKLFISLQTVKDHTHRIYNKVNVRSRVQLITLVREGNLLSSTES